MIEPAPACPRPDKHCYVSRTDAKLTLRKLQGEGVVKGAKHLTVYLCRCGWFHIGNLPPAHIREGRPDRGE